MDGEFQEELNKILENYRLAKISKKEICKRMNEIRKEILSHSWENISIENQKMEIILAMAKMLHIHAIGREEMEREYKSLLKEKSEVDQFLGLHLQRYVIIKKMQDEVSLMADDEIAGDAFVCLLSSLGWAPLEQYDEAILFQMLEQYCEAKWDLVKRFVGYIYMRGIWMCVEETSIPIAKELFMSMLSPECRKLFNKIIVESHEFELRRK